MPAESAVYVFDACAVMLDPIAFGTGALTSTSALARSALPGAPVIEDTPSPHTRLIRRSTAWRLRRIADRLAPA